jgi:putative lysine transport system ATP-binding protein
MVFQSFNLFNKIMSVLENCVVGQVRVLRRGADQARKHAMEYLERVGMAALYQRPAPADLSAVRSSGWPSARAMAMDPEVLLLRRAHLRLDPEMEWVRCFRHAYSGPVRHDHAGGDPRDGLRPRRQPAGGVI